MPTSLNRTLGAGETMQLELQVSGSSVEVKVDPGGRGASKLPVDSYELSIESMVDGAMTDVSGSPVTSSDPEEIIYVTNDAESTVRATLENTGPSEGSASIEITETDKPVGGGSNTNRVLLSQNVNELDLPGGRLVSQSQFESDGRGFLNPVQAGGVRTRPVNVEDKNVSVSGGGGTDQAVAAVNNSILFEAGYAKCALKGIYVFSGSYPFAYSRQSLSASTSGESVTRYNALTLTISDTLTITETYANFGLGGVSVTGSIAGGSGDFNVTFSFSPSDIDLINSPFVRTGSALRVTAKSYGGTIDLTQSELPNPAPSPNAYYSYLMDGAITGVNAVPQSTGDSVGVYAAGSIYARFDQTIDVNSFGVNIYARQQKIPVPDNTLYSY